MLPVQLLHMRVQRELEACRNIPGVTIEGTVDYGKTEFPICLDVYVTGATGMMIIDGKAREIDSHRFAVEIGRDYPYQKPGVFWQTPIFHPNICPPEDGGMVCTKLLNEWRGERTLYSLINAVLYLVEHPNGREPLGADACMNAARYLLERSGNAGKDSQQH